MSLRKCQARSCMGMYLPVIIRSQVLQLAFSSICHQEIDRYGNIEGKIIIISSREL